MSLQDATYQNSKVGMTQDADTVFVKSDGYFQTADVRTLGSKLKADIYATGRNVVIANSAGVMSTQVAGESAAPVLPSYYGVIFLSFADAASNASARLPSAVPGMFLTLRGRGAGSAYSIIIYGAGATSGIASADLIGSISGALSSIKMHGSAGSQPLLILYGTDDGKWAVMDKAGQVTEQGAS